jgi:hypothetical protein
VFVVLYVHTNSLVLTDLVVLTSVFSFVEEENL